MVISKGIPTVGKYSVGKVLGTGSFGELCKGKNMETREEVAIKFEVSPEGGNPQPTLQFEFDAYRRLGKTIGIPKLLYFAEVPNRPCHVLIMELLGDSLEGLFNKCERIFCLKTVLQIGVQLIDRIEYVHKKTIIHRDIKPDNFLLGKKGGPNAKIIHIIDFGLAKQYLDERGKHIPMRDGALCLGTSRYMSISAHKLKTQSRKDDLESICYVLIYFLRGQLPWQGLDSSLSPNERTVMIGRIKEKTSTGVLCEGCPAVFEKFIKYVRALEFSETPDYDYLRELFKSCFKKEGFKWDDHYDWDNR